MLLCGMEKPGIDRTTPGLEGEQLLPLRHGGFYLRDLTEFMPSSSEGLHNI